ncbi:hypothetical protein GCM10020229_68520 [Kitasatospora albolonga]
MPGAGAVPTLVATRRRRAIECWLAEAREHAWAPAVMGASEEAGVIYARHGLDALELGDEAIVELDEFSLDGRAMRVVRQAYNRVKRAGTPSGSAGTRRSPRPRWPSWWRRRTTGGTAPPSAASRWRSAAWAIRATAAA